MEYLLGLEQAATVEPGPVSQRLEVLGLESSANRPVVDEWALQRAFVAQSIVAERTRAWDVSAVRRLPRYAKG